MYYTKKEGVPYSKLMAGHFDFQEVWRKTFEKISSYTIQRQQVEENK